MFRIHLSILLSLFVYSAGYGQIVTSDPEFPTADKSVDIFFDATEGTAGLKDHQGDVYAHTGVLTTESTNGSDWKYVVAEWTENKPKAKMERISANRYKLDITPSIREYYGVPDDEKITHLAFVFRNSDGTREGKAEGGEDIFVEVFENEVNVKFAQPADNPGFSSKSDSVSVRGIGTSESGNLTLSLFIDNQKTEEVSGDTLDFTFLPQNEGSLKLMLTGSDGNLSDTALTTVVANPPVDEQARPAGLRDGITYVDGSTVRLSLFAPHKEFVYAIGDFNNWEFRPEFFMKRDSVNADTVYWWTEISNLTPGQEYGFQYLVDGKIRLADPYSEKVLDPNHNRNIPASIFPGLKPFPEGKTEHIVGVLEPGKQEYTWQTNSYDRPDKENLVIYELLVRDFVEDHDFETLIDTLDYLDRLGVNAIELMPVMEFDANSSWGYNPTFHLATDKYYGPEENLKRFIDECHARNIAVILDMVLNHAWGPSPLVRLWNDGDFGKPTLENPYLNREPRHDFNVGFDFNHESAATQHFVDRVNEYWLKEFRFDGFRFDLSKGFTQKNTLGNVGAWGQFDASRVRLLQRMADQIWAVDDSAYVILEHFADNSEEMELSSRGMMLWGNMNFNYNEATMGFHGNGKSNFSGVYHGSRGWSAPHLVGYMESHDEERLMVKNLSFGNSSAGYNVKNFSIGLNRIKLAAAFFFPIPGPKMIWQFGELGYDISIDENGRTGEKPVKWEYFSDEERKRLYNTFKALIRLRNAHPAFTSENSELTLDLADSRKRITIDHPDMKVSIVGNFDVTAGTIQPSFVTNGTWYDFFSGDSLTVTDTDTTINLAPGEFHVYTTQKFERPQGNPLEQGPDETNEGEGDTEITSFTLHQNYPNPFNPSTTIPYDLPEPAEVRLEVYNTIGQRVMVMDVGEQPAGSHTLKLDIPDLSSGLYIYRLQAGSQASTRKMLLVK